MKGAPRAANLDHILTGFEPSKRYTDLLKKFDAMCDYIKLANKTPPCLRLKRADFVHLSALIRRQSQGQRTQGALTYRGHAISSAGE